MRSQRRAIWRNVGANAFGQAGQAFLQLAITPLFLLAWGVTRYGDWLLLSTIPAYLATSDLGMISVAANEMSAAMSKGDRNRARRVYQSAWALTSVLSIGLSGVAIALLLLIGPTTVLSLKTVDVETAALILLILGVYAVLTQQSGVLQAGLRAADRTPSSILLMNIVRIAETAAAAAAALLTGGLVAAAATMLVVRMIGLIFQFALLQRASSVLRLGIRSASFGTLRVLARPSLAFFVMPLGNALSLQVFLLVLAHGVDRHALVAFTLLRTLSRLGTQVVGILEASLWPEASIAYGVGNLTRLRNLHDRACGASFYLAVIMASGLAVLAIPFVQIWTAGRVVPQLDMVLLLCLDVVITSLWSTSAVVPYATNRLEGVAISFIACSALSLLILLPLVRLFGIAGAPVAMCIADLLMIPLTLRVSLPMTKNSVRNFARAFSLRAVAGTVRLAVARRDLRAS